MTINYRLLSEERRAAIALIAAHRKALGYDPVDPEDFDDMRYAITDVLTALRIHAASVELEFDVSLHLSDVCARDIMHGNL